ncbi:TonB-dependent receptor plug domain-containing protein [Sphingomonas bacterium]|uniref:TonB-dependent receptor plug domain-containing protein n=1 Tax=Sphingomonas bacterium TaxID=1895847 RepID=UPI001575BA0A|nr:TonB-dependent receptor [Sphingomonas bacterium]
MTRRTILFLGAGMMALQAGGAYAQTAPGDDASKEIIVTGTRGTTRTVAQSLAPIDVLSPADLQTSGKQSVRDLLGALIPSISVSNSGAGASFAVKTLSLRGLAGDQVLVLVNGKRRHNTATMFINGTTQNGQSPPDLDLIPTAAIGRIEVLRDGASAQYGSDAIAGVINLILRSSDHGGDANVLGGRTYDGGGQTGQVQGVLGFGLGAEGHVDVAIDGRYQARTYRGGPNTTQLYPAGDPREATANRYTTHPGQPQAQTASISYDASLPLGDNLTLYSFSTGAVRKTDAFLTFRNPIAANNIPEVYPDGYSPELRVYDKDFQVAAGIKGGGLAGFDWDLSTTYGYNRAAYHEKGLNASLGPASPKDAYLGLVASSEWTTDVDLKRTFDIGTAAPLLIDFGGAYRRNTYKIGPGEPASYVDGGYRNTTGLNANVVRQAGSQGVTGFQPVGSGRWSRNNVAAFVDVEDTVLPGLDLALAGRYEHYNDAGTTKTGKASIRYEPIRGLAFRGTASTGFRAPTLQQEHYASSSTIGVTVAGVTTLQPVQALPVDSPAAIALGAKPLKPEKSTNFSAGTVLTMIPRLNLTVDAYQIKIRDRILLSGVLSGAAVNAALAAAGILTAQQGFYFSNAADTRTRGLDVVATYRTKSGPFGQATITLSGNINHTKFTYVALPPPALAAAGLVLIDRARQGDFTQGTPRDKEIVAVDWTIGKIGVNARVTRYSKVVQTSTIPANDDILKPKAIIDLSAGYALTSHLRLTAGANNLLNTYSSILKAANRGLVAATGATSNTAYYNSYSPFGISGGFYYGRINLSF